MDIPFSTNITSINGIGKRSRLQLQLKDIASELPLPENLQSGLIRLSNYLAETSLHILTSSEGAENHFFEGRGRYSTHSFESLPITVYSKGVGSIGAIHENPGESFGAFGPVAKKYLYDKADHPNHFLRLIGAEFIYDAQREFYHALRVMVNFIQRHDINTIDGLIENRVTIPLSISHYDGLTDYLKEQVLSELTGDWKWDDEIRLGAVSLIVPSDCRIDRKISSNHIPRAELSSITGHEWAFREAFK